MKYVAYAGIGLATLLALAAINNVPSVFDLIIAGAAIPGSFAAGRWSKKVS